MFDSTVIPSYLGAQPRGTDGDSDSQLTNYVLREGEVKRVYGKDHTLNFSKKYTEYEVDVVHRDGTGIATATSYRGVAALSLFGGQADYSKIRYRGSTKTDPDTGVGNGSKVVLLCVSGDQQRAVILGGLDVHEDIDSDHKYKFEFNGLHVEIDSEGQLLVLHRGPTDNDGAVLEQYQGFEGCKLAVDKRANILLSGHNEKQSIRIVNQDPDAPETDQSIYIKADQKFVVESSGTSEHNVKGNVFIDSAEGAINLTSNDGTYIGRATDFMMLGSTYRNAEGTCNQSVGNAATAASGALGAASAALTTAAPLLAVPMVGGILAMPSIILAATQLATAAAQMGVIGTSYAKLEAMADTYLSSKNKND